MRNIIIALFVLFTGVCATLNAQNSVQPTHSFAVVDTPLWALAQKAVHYSTNEYLLKIVLPANATQENFKNGNFYQNMDDNSRPIMVKAGVVIYFPNPNEKQDTTVSLPLASTIAPALPVSQSPNIGNDDDKPWWAVLLFFGAIAAMIAFVLLRNRGTFDANPVTGGAPIVEGGIRPENAAEYAQQLVNQQNPNVNAPVRNVRSGRFYGRGDSYFANRRQGRTSRFNGERGYEGEITNNSGDVVGTVQFLEACGNPVRQGQYMTGLRFVPDTVFTQPNPEQTPGTQNSETTTTTAPVVTDPANVATQTKFTQVTQLLTELQKTGGKVKIGVGGDTFEIEVPVNAALPTATQEGAKG